MPKPRMTISEFQQLGEALDAQYPDEPPAVLADAMGEWVASVGDEPFSEWEHDRVENATRAARRRRA